MGWFRKTFSIIGTNTFEQSSGHAGMTVRLMRRKHWRTGMFLASYMLFESPLNVLLDFLTH